MDPGGLGDLVPRVNHPTSLWDMARISPPLGWRAIHQTRKRKASIRAIRQIIERHGTTQAGQSFRLGHKCHGDRVASALGTETSAVVRWVELRGAEPPTALG